MFKSKTHLYFRCAGKRFLVPLSYVAIIESQNIGHRGEAIRLALSEVLGYDVPPSVEIDYNRDFDRVYDEAGNVIPTGRFTVNEHSTGFSVTHNKTGLTRWLSDGVDAFGYDYDDDFCQLHPGSLGFAELWTELMNEDEGTTMEAYFPDVIDED